jgi:hypothetical protein
MMSCDDRIQVTFDCSERILATKKKKKMIVKTGSCVGCFLPNNKTDKVEQPGIYFIRILILIKA